MQPSKRFLGIAGAALVTAAILGGTAFFRGVFSPHASVALESFNELYGTKGTRLDACSTCHTVGRLLNSYGADGRAAFFKAMGADRRTEAEQITLFVGALRAIDALDSDGDGYSNLEEIKASTFPGDRNDHPNGRQ